MKREEPFTFLSPSLILFLSLVGLIKLSCARLYLLPAYSSLQCNNYQNGCISHSHTTQGEATGGALMSLVINTRNQSVFLVNVLLLKWSKRDFVWYRSDKNVFMSLHLHMCAHICVCVCLVALYASVSRVQYLLPKYLARGAVCCLNKGSQSPALKRTFIKHSRSLHLFLLAKTDKLGRPLCHITLCVLPSVLEGVRYTYCSWRFSH